MVPLTAVSTWASSVVGEKLVVLKVTMVASPSTDKLMNEALHRTMMLDDLHKWCVKYVNANYFDM